MSARSRLTLKVLWMWALITALILFAQVRYEFIYQAF
jgi:hypothetical protein